MTNLEWELGSEDNPIGAALIYYELFDRVTFATVKLNWDGEKTRVRATRFNTTYDEFQEIYRNAQIRELDILRITHCQSTLDDIFGTYVKAYGVLFDAKTKAGSQPASGHHQPQRKD